MDNAIREKAEAYREETASPSRVNLRWRGHGAKGKGDEGAGND